MPFSWYDFALALALYMSISLLLGVTVAWMIRWIPDEDEY